MNSPLKHSQTLKTNQQLWGEFKIEGKNITSRSYSAIAIHQDVQRNCSQYYIRLYVHGGYQVSSGILKSFNKLVLNQAHYKWSDVTQNNAGPGPLNKHQAIVHSNELYFFGGSYSATKQTNKTHVFNVTNALWHELPINDSYPPPYDNHACTIFNSQVIIFGGFYQGNLKNTLYSYDLNNNQWTILNEQNKSKSPSPREGCGIAQTNQRIYIFGGTNGMTRFSDLWVFLLETRSWTSLNFKNDLHPMSRNGLTLNHWKDKLVLFGGIHDITWELDDLWAYDIRGSKWMQVQEDSARRSEIVVMSKQETSSMNTQRRTQKSFSNSKSPLRKKQSQFRKPSEKPSSRLVKTMASDEQFDKPRHNTLEDQRRKEFEIRKLDMLKQFEVSEDKAEQLRSLSPTSETMRNALHLIGDNKWQTRQNRYMDFGKQTFSKPLQNVSNMFIGKRPCARDGHRSVIYQNYLLIFGGDRHQMSFNDIHALSLDLID